MEAMPAKHLSEKEDKGGDGSGETSEEESHKTIARRDRRSCVIQLNFQLNSKSKFLGSCENWTLLSRKRGFLSSHT